MRVKIGTEMNVVICSKRLVRRIAPSEWANPPRAVRTTRLVNTGKRFRAELTWDIKFNRGANHFEVHVRRCIYPGAPWAGYAWVGN